MHLVDDHRPNPLDKLSPFGIGPSQENIQGFGGGEDEVGPASSRPLGISRANPELKTQTFDQNRGQTPFEIESQRPCRNHVEKSVRLVRADQSFHAGSEDGLGLPRPRRRLQNEITTGENRRDGFSL